MTDESSECTEIHTRLLKFALGVEPSRDYWSHVEPGDVPVEAERAFQDHWFGNATESRVRIILTNMRVRYDAYPAALEVLAEWGPSAPPDVRRLVCHWHLQLADPMYRRFTAEFLPSLRGGADSSVKRHDVIRWVEEQQPERWSNRTLVQWASKLLSAAHDTGLVAEKRDPRRLALPNVPDAALSYICHLLRQVKTEGDILENPYLRSVGLEGRFLEDRLRRLTGVELHRMGDLIDFKSSAENLQAWKEAML